MCAKIENISQKRHYLNKYRSCTTRMSRLFVTLVALFCVLLLSKTASGNAAVEKFMNSSCGKLSGAASPHREMMLGLLPTPEFWDFFANRTSRSNIMLVDVDRYSWDLLLNEVVALRKTGSGMANHVYAIGYDKHSCGNLTSAGVACYYNATWQDRLASKFQEQSRHLAQPLHMVMMGRMMTSVAALCEGHNVFLSDTDVVFYRDPIQYTFRETDMMIAATRVKPELKKWGGTFFTDHPDQYFTLNNGVVFYRSNQIMQHFVISLAEACLKSLKGPARQFDFDQGFLQKVFNKQMVDAKLTLVPTSKFSDPVTYRLNTRNLTNTVGECYDCHYGTLSWPPSSVVPASHHNVLKIGIFPLTRFTSFCWAAPGFNESVIESAHALRRHNTTDWGWGALPNNQSRVLYTHANCVDVGAKGYERFQKKRKWFRSVKSWFA